MPIGERVPPATGQLKEDALVRSQLGLFQGDETGVGQNIHPSLKGGPVGPRSHRFNRGFPVADHDLGPKLPGPAGEFGNLLQRHMGQFDAGQELCLGVFIFLYGDLV